jgi:hypothetical protein
MNQAIKIVKEAFKNIEKNPTAFNCGQHFALSKVLSALEAEDDKMIQETQPQEEFEVEGFFSDLADSIADGQGLFNQMGLDKSESLR